MQDHSFYLQSVVEIQRSIGSITAGLSGISTRLDKLEAKVDAASNDISVGKGAFGTLKWVLGGLGAVITLLLGTILTVLVNHFSKH